MRLLAFETSTERLSLAILNGDDMRVREIDAGQRHSELAIAELTDLLAEAGCVLADLDAIAFGRGPGSFVGIRIACGLAQGLALGAGKPVVPVVTLMALAEQADSERVMVAVDARMGEFYIAAYRRSHTEASGWHAVVVPMLARPDQLPVLDGTDWCGIGSAFDAPTLQTILADRYSGTLERVQAGALPSATHIARIATRQLERAWMGSAFAPGLATPLYLRNHVALTIDERRVAKAAKDDNSQRVPLPDVAV